MSYTKGPWTADDTSVKCGRDMIASVFDPKDSCHRTEVGMANARLIAAAPDMLEALRHPVRKDIDSNGNVCIRIPLEQYIAILSKAEGGQA